MLRVLIGVLAIWLSPAIVEAIVAAAFAVASLAGRTGSPLAGIEVRLALRIGIGDVLLGMFALALVAWRLAGSGWARGSCRPGSRCVRSAT